MTARWNQSFSDAILFFHHRLFDTLQTFFLSVVSTVQKSPLINLPFHRKDGNNNCVYEQFVILKNKNNSIQIRYNYSTHKSEYFSAPCSIACSTENMSFMRNILSLPISVCSTITCESWTHNSMKKHNWYRLLEYCPEHIEIVFRVEKTLIRNSVEFM